MSSKIKSIFAGKNQLLKNSEVTGEYCTINNEIYYKISNVDRMRPFFMSVVSDSDHWMFMASNGGLTAGRKNADNALFPYYTDDKITESAEITGSKTIFLVSQNKQISLWEPFSNRFPGIYKTQRNCYKNTLGNKLIFEEFNADLQLTFRYHWNFSEQFGFVKIAELINHNPEKVEVSLLDGIQNLLPYGISSALQNDKSNLVNAYKKNELIPETGLGIVMLSAVIVDRPEPGEALKATTVWSCGLENSKKLVSSIQLEHFRSGFDIEQETDVRAEKGAYFIQSELQLQPKETKQWITVAEVNQGSSEIAKLNHFIKNAPEIIKTVFDDIQKGTQKLTQLAGNADGLQFTEDKMVNNRHFSNAMFNIMRGGIFDFNYSVESNDFIEYISKSNKKLAEIQASFFKQLPSLISYQELLFQLKSIESADLNRLALMYLPLKFSRRHGDPSRPWNRFSIETKDEKGNKILNYEGNWRDIFQNWEALAYSYPRFLESMIAKFANASTFEGYNPYRINKYGFDWETVEHDDPWSFIGYWGDHQIIYLLKLLELSNQFQPNELKELLHQELFVYANVPYKIKSYNEIFKNPKDTIEFDAELDNQLRKEITSKGTDATLMNNQSGSLHYVNLMEKLLISALAKLVNFIPEAGIWLNTQRPEWNDANNALVGNGTSMVTLYYLRRYLVFLRELISDNLQENFAVSEDVFDLFSAVHQHFHQFESTLNSFFNKEQRKKFMDILGLISENYRSKIYNHHFKSDKKAINSEDVISFIDISLKFINHSIKANKRSDSLYHAYNLINFDDEKSVSITHLYEMLEGQVAVLSSGFLTAEEVLQNLESLSKSQLYRENQQSYLLYPDRQLKRFTEKNCIKDDLVNQSALLKKLIEDKNTDLMEQDINGIYHFNADFNNQSSVESALEKLTQKGYGNLVNIDRKLILDIFENTFQHKLFTGRSGTFYGYEGLGSIYWHMVSKLLLAVQECYWRGVETNENKEILSQLANHYYSIREGIGMYKSPDSYGAFPTDPYSHTPGNAGVQQPGMTGQVKEDVISRFGELGIRVKEGKLTFNPLLLRKSEFLSQNKTIQLEDVHQQKQAISLEKGQLCFTFCQLPIIYQLSHQNTIHLFDFEGIITTIDSLTLDENQSNKLFDRSGAFKKLVIEVDENLILK
ncbi:MAG: hypothetical protein Q8J84_08590 [Flavobacteriaceae bacterium]|nr:hypothetical protein [Flavobacteriaceae bacterium]